MRKIFVLLLAVTLSTSAMASGGSDQSQPKKQEQRKSKKSDKINNALEILRSGKFKIEEPLSRDEIQRGFFSGRTKTAAKLDISDQRYEVRSVEIDTVKNIYTINFAYTHVFQGHEWPCKVIYNFKTGYLRVEEFTGHRELDFEGNYSYILPLDE